MAQGESAQRNSGTREVILETAERLLAERGFAATSIRDIVGAAGISAPSLYHFFGSKENLLIELVTDRYTRYCDALEAQLASASTAFEVCKQFFEFALENMAQEPTTAKFLFSIMFGPQQDIPKEPLRELLVRWELIVHERLCEVAPDVSEARVVFARTMLNGLMTPPVLLFLTAGIKTFPKELPACLAFRVADVLTDEHPICAWPSLAVDVKER
jgi:AcrR family transcriptional regulator